MCIDPRALSRRNYIVYAREYICARSNEPKQTCWEPPSAINRFFQGSHNRFVSAAVADYSKSVSLAAVYKCSPEFGVLILEFHADVLQPSGLKIAVEFDQQRPSSRIHCFYSQTTVIKIGNSKRAASLKRVVRCILHHAIEIRGPDKVDRAHLHQCCQYGVAVGWLSATYHLVDIPLSICRCRINPFEIIRVLRIRISSRCIRQGCAIGLEALLYTRISEILDLANRYPIP